jgi:hypothetical protein
MAVAKARRKKAAPKKAASKKKATSSARRKPSGRKQAGRTPSKARVAPKKAPVRRKRARTRPPLPDAYAAIVLDEQDPTNPLASDEYADANQLIDEVATAEDVGR